MPLKTFLEEKLIPFDLFSSSLILYSCRIFKLTARNQRPCFGQCENHNFVDLSWTSCFSSQKWPILVDRDLSESKTACISQYQQQNNLKFGQWKHPSFRHSSCILTESQAVAIRMPRRSQQPCARKHISAEDHTVLLTQLYADSKTVDGRNPAITTWDAKKPL